MEKLKLNDSMQFVMVCAIFFAALQFFQQQFIYRHDVFFTQPWRWWTGHWVHVGWIHYLLNVLVFACLPFLFPNIKKISLIILLLLLPPLLSFSFYLIYPHIFAYAGLSGILHGLFIFCAIVSLKNKADRHFSALIIVIVLAKIIWEYYFGSLQTAQLIGSPVLTQAHLLGVIFGGLLAVFILIFQLQVVQKNE